MNFIFIRALFFIFLISVHHKSNAVISNKIEEHFFISCEKNDLITVAELLTKAPFLINQQNQYGSTSLMIAIEQNNPKLVTLLLEKGASIKTHQNSDQLTPFLIALLYHNVHILEMLLDHPDFKSKDHATNEHTALEFAQLIKRPLILQMVKKAIDKESVTA